MLKQEKGSSPQRGKPGSQRASGNRGGKGVATSNDANQNGVLQYALIRLSVMMLLFFCGKFMRLKTFYALKQLVNQSRPKGWTKKRFSLLSYVKNLLSKTIFIPFDLFGVFEGSKKTGALMDMNRIDRYQMQNYGLMLITIPLASRVITAVMKIPRSYSDRIITARAITNACTSNPLIVILPVTIAAYLGAIDLLDTYQTATKTRTLGTVSTRNAQWIIVYNNLKSLMAVAQSGANANQSQAIVIIESGLFKVKSTTARKAGVFMAVHGLTSGTVILSAAGASKTAMHEWEMSLDGITFTSLPNTRLSKTTVSGLIPISKIWFRHRTVDGAVATDWDYIYFIVT